MILAYFSLHDFLEGIPIVLFVMAFILLMGSET